MIHCAILYDITKPSFSLFNAEYNSEFVVKLPIAHLTYRFALENYVILQFGRVEEHEFTMDYQYPMSAIQVDLELVLYLRDGRLILKLMTMCHLFSVLITQTNRNLILTHNAIIIEITEISFFNQLIM